MNLTSLKFQIPDSLIKVSHGKRVAALGILHFKIHRIHELNPQ